MNYRVTLGLLIVLVLLGGAVYLVERNPATPTPVAGQSLPTPAPVWSLAAGDITAIAVTAEGKTVAVARSADGKWALTAPESGEADQTRLESLVGRLSLLQASRTIDAPSSLAEYGLERPSAEAKVTLKSGETKTLLVGDQTPDKAASYARLPGVGSVYILQGTVGGELTSFVSAPPKPLPTSSAPLKPAP